MWKIYKIWRTGEHYKIKGNLRNQKNLIGKVLENIEKAGESKEKSNF